MKSIEIRGRYIAYVFESDQEIQSRLAAPASCIKQEDINVVDLSVQGINSYPFFAVETKEREYIYCVDEQEAEKKAEQCGGSIFIFEKDWDPASLETWDVEPWIDHMGVLPHHHYED